MQLNVRFHRYCRNVFYIMLVLVLAIFFSCGWTIGSQPGEGGKVIANWDFVPYQYISSKVNIGIVAFHEKGVDIVFEINGVKNTITKPSKNNDTSPDKINSILSLEIVESVTFSSVYEYYITIDPALYADGPLIIKATAYPDGEPGSSKKLELPDLTVFCNSNGTLSNNAVLYASPTADDSTGNGTITKPYSIEKAYVSVGAGGTVRLLPGTYTWKSGVATGGKYLRWTTIISNSGSPADVIVSPDIDPDIFWQNYVKWSKVTIRKAATVGCNEAYFAGNSNYYTWFDQCIIESGQTGEARNASIINAQGSKYYMTDCHIKDFANANGWWMRNCVIENVGADVWKAASGLFLVNIEIRGMNPVSSAHPDMIQFYNPDTIADNIILYNIKAIGMNAQGIFGSRGSNVAFVNMFLHKEVQDYAISQMGTFNHVLFWHCTTYKTGLGLVNGERSLWDVRNNIFQNFTDGNSVLIIDKSVIRRNHFIARQWGQASDGCGEEFTGCISNDTGYNDATGTDPGFVNPTSNDFRINLGSLAYHAGEPIECVPADINGNLFNITTPTIGAFISTTE